MNDEHTVKHEVSPTPDAPDFTPASPAPEPATGIRKNRIKTWGERVFDLKTYGGVALLGNEAASLVIMNQAQHGITKDWHAKQMSYFKGLEGKKFIPKYISNGHLLNVLIAVIGGMTMVPFVKYLEDHKGEIVRKSDRKHYGTYADSDPAIVAAHQEMDEAPKQTWGSLWKGRILTVVAAIGLDWSVGCADAQSNKLFKNNATFQKFANMDRLAERVSSGVMNTLNIAKPARPTWDRWLKQGSWLLVFSSTLTVLFYASSKLFASSRERKIERRQEAIKTGAPLHDDAIDANDTTAAVDTSPSSEKPQLQVNAVNHENRIATAPQLAQSM